MCVYRGNRAEAYAIGGMLRANGIDAVVESADVRPEFGFVEGTRVLVLASDEEDARKLIDDPESVPN